jgi:hypothetical protein
MGVALRVSIAAAVVVLCACGQPTSPLSPSIGPFASNKPSPVGFPAITEPARIFVVESAPALPEYGSPMPSRYVLYDDGRFALQYLSLTRPFFQYTGRYTDVNGAITFNWNAANLAGSWGATGALTAGRLTVHYNTVMILDDFEDGVYVLAD